MDTHFDIQILSAYLKNTVFPLTGEIHLCGRSKKDCDLFINDVTLSHVHCRFRRCGRTYCVMDMDSTNGMWVNGIPALEEMPLSDCDIVTMGNVEVIFRTNDPCLATPHEPLSRRTHLDLRNLCNDTSTTSLQTMTLVNMSPYSRPRCCGKLTGVVLTSTIASMVMLVLCLLTYLIMKIYASH